MLLGKRHFQLGRFNMTQNESKNEALRELLASLRKDPTDDDLWRKLYREIRRFIYAIAYRVLNGNEELAKDATQDVFLRLFKYCEFTEFSEPQEFLGYVAVVARHAALNLVKREGKYVTGLDITLCDFMPGTPTPLQHERAKNRLHDVLEQLDPDEVVLVELMMNGSSLEDIAKGLEISYANAAVRIHRLREKLLKRLNTR